jgi:hypothetical protein
MLISAHNFSTEVAFFVSYVLFPDYNSILKTFLVITAFSKASVPKG